jgi:glycine cleavage system T protein
MHARETSLHPWHADHGARFTDFAGWDMPVQYRTGTIAEHHATRNSAGLFDISHMGQVRVSGSAAAKWLASLVTADITALAEGSSTYALLCRDDGGVIDDLFVYRTGPEAYLVVVNASRRERDVAWLESHLPPSGVTLRDESDETAMIAVQGPRAVQLSALVLGEAVLSLPRFGITSASLEIPGGAPVAIEAARTGYTGEDGLELFLPASAALPLWMRLLAAGEEHGIAVAAVGLGARDSLRLEAGFALYGHELTEELTPVEARLVWACHLDHEFIGRDAIVARKEQKPARTLRRLVMVESGVPREGYSVFAADGRKVGVVVSGGRAPSLSAFIANAYVDRDVPPTEALAVEIRNRKVAARQNRGPVYKPAYRRVDPALCILDRSGEYAGRHLGPRSTDVAEMLATIGAESMDQLIDATVPAAIRRKNPLSIPRALTEDQLLARLRR